MQKIESSRRIRCRTPDEAFHQIIRQHENALIETFVAAFAEAPAPDVWFTSSASRNVASEPITKNVVYLKFSEDFLSDRPGTTTTFLVSSPALAVALFQAAGVVAPPRWRLRRWLYRIELKARVLYRCGAFLAKIVKRKILARRRGLKCIGPSLAPTVVIRSWVTKGCLTAESGPRPYRYKDRNFGDLLGYLRSKGFRTVLLPMFFNLDTSEIEASWRLDQAGENVLVPELQVGFGECFRSVARALRLSGLKFENASFGGLDVSAVFREGHLRSHASPELLSLNLCYPALKTLSRRNIPVEAFYYPWENNAAEKPFLLAARQYFPEAEVIGFQHSVCYREQIAMKVLSAELASHPLPDRIVCSGRVYLDVLGELGFPRSKIELGANLRYPEVNACTLRGPLPHGPETVFAVLTFNESHTRELLVKLSRALKLVRKSRPGVRLLLKPHPLLDIKELRSFVESLECEPFEIVGGTVQEWIRRVSVVAMVGGSVSCLEALAAGVPLVRLSLATDFDFDCIWTQNRYDGFAYSQNDLVEGLLKGLSDSIVDETLSTTANEIKDEYFEPVTARSLEVFLPKTLRSSRPQAPLAEL